MGLSGIAKQTLEIVATGAYQAPSGRRVELSSAVASAVRETVLYTPDELERLVTSPGASAAASSASTRMRIEVTAESTAEAGRRLVAKEGEVRVLALNFASAKNPGGGFLGGAKAQEEDLARCSALYTCQLEQLRFYEANRACESMLYTDHMIYSPAVPFFRDDALDLLEETFELAILTAPAPNAGEHLRRHADGLEAIQRVLAARGERVLAVAKERGHRVLVLGAWGCGVFRNDPVHVADVFARLLAAPRFVGAFDRVVFAIYDRSKSGATLAAFRERFAA